MQAYIYNRISQESNKITNSRDNCIENFDVIVRMIKSRFFGLNDEHLLLMLADRQKRINFCDIIFKGNPETINIDKGSLIKIVSNNNAKFAIIAHNHPSEISLPSRRDLETTKQIKEALNLIDVELVDHFIVTTSECVSLSGCGIL